VIDVLIFSKDRPMQLDALLRSMVAHLGGTFPSVSVLTPDADPPRGWWATLPEDPFGFESRTRQWIEYADRYIMFLTDDCLFYRSALHPVYAHIPYSYRLGGNTCICQVSGRKQAVPATFGYEWSRAEGDFGYPLSLDATVYDKRTLLPLLDFSFANPTELEAGLASRAGRFHETSPLMHMGAHSSVVSIPHNRVTTSSSNPISGDPRYSVEQLRADFAAGKRIRLAEMDFSDVRGAHQVIDYVVR
jgi:hypothetical protein